MRVSGHRVHFVNCDLQRLPFKCEYFDCVTCGFVLEHLSDVRQGLSEMSRVLRPGGRLLLLMMTDSVLSALTAKIWRCHTLNRDDIIGACDGFRLDLRTIMNLDGWQRFVRGEGLALSFRKGSA